MKAPLLILSVLAASLSSFTADARVLRLNCEKNLVEENFFTCDDGEAGAPTPCGSRSVALGTMQFAMMLDSDANRYGGTLTVSNQPQGGSAQSAGLRCVRGTESWNSYAMSCTTEKPVLGERAVTLSFSVGRFEAGEETVAFNTVVRAGDGFKNVANVVSHLDCKEVR